jgi:hypothetical protein
MPALRGSSQSRLDRLSNEVGNVKIERRADLLKVFDLAALMGICKQTTDAIERYASVFRRRFRR